ncbi:MAG: gliding motility-associated C-terminal domain-containing protein [Saprospirales bacterium]|nr:MAG: gliding motility-associated C-terminal domain-containing protein [Saprospirales bacterium]
MPGYHTLQLEVIIPCEAINADLHNAFTPNNDGINDSEHKQGLEYCGPAELIVFNRLGNKVYPQRDIENNWRGQSSNGEGLPQGTYFVVLEYRQYGIIKQGTIDLRRG